MVFRQIVMRIFLFFVTGSTLSAAFAQEDEFAIGFLHAGSVRYIMYYQQGSWKAPVVGYFPTFTRPASVAAYAKTVWNRRPELFSTWYEINAPNPVAIQSKDSLMEQPNGCEGAIMALRTDAGGKDGPGSAWVATRKGGVKWNDFETVGHVVSDSNYQLYKTSLVTPIRKEYIPLAEQMKSRWADLEAGMYLKAIQEANFKKPLASTEYHEFVAQRAPLTNGKTLVFFFASKLMQWQRGSDQDSVKDMYVWYRGWALVEPDGSVSWPYAVVVLPGDRTDAWLFPEGILEFDNKQFLVAETQVEWTKEKKVYEFLNGKFKYQSKALVEGCLED